MIKRFLTIVAVSVLTVSYVAIFAGCGSNTIRIYVPDGPLYFAGCYRQEAGSPLRNFVILTRDAVNGIEDIHDRMPVIIPSELAEAWLHESPDAIESAIVDLTYKIAV